MSRINSYAHYANLVPQVQPLDTAATAVSGQFIDLCGVHHVSFLVMFGTLTSTSADEVVTITVEAATGAASTSGENIAFAYRQSGAVAANTWGAVTAATSAGVTFIATAGGGTSVWIDVDPSAVAAAKTDGRYVRLEVTPAAGFTATNVAAIAFVEPTYAQTTMESTT